MPTRNRTLSWLILAGILLLATFLRFRQLDILPPGLYHDEAYNGLDALSLLDGKTFPQFYEGWELYAADAHAQRDAMETRFPLFFEGNYGREPLHVYLMALSISLFGATPFAVRAVPAAAGVLAVLTTFLAARALFSGTIERGSVNGIALLSAFFLAILYPAVHFSRFGIRAMLFVPVQTMAVACFWWAINRSKRSGSDITVWLLFIASGFFIGLGIYTFAAARLFPLVWLLFVPLWFWIDRQAFAAHWRHILALGGAALVTALPLLLFFARYPYYFVFRIAYVANKGKGAVEGRPAMTWLLNTGRVTRGLLWQGETHLRHNLPARPFLDPIQAVLFLIGLGRSLYHFAQPRYLFLLIWFGVMLLPSILSGDAPHFGRLSGAAAPAAILTALGARLVWLRAGAWLARYLPERRATWLVSAVMLLLLAASAVITIRDYFGRYAAHPDLAEDFYVDEWRMGQYAATAVSENARLFLTPTQEELATMFFALGDAERLRNYEGSADLLPAGTPGLETLYLLRSGESETRQAIENTFAEVSAGPPGEGYGAYHIAANAPRPRPDQEAMLSFGGKIDLDGWSAAVDDDELIVTLTWRAVDDMDQDYTAFLHLVDGAGQLVAQKDQAPPGYPTSDWAPGEIIIARYAVPLPPGIGLDQVEVRTGFYMLPDLEPLGETAVLAAPGELKQ